MALVWFMNDFTLEEMETIKRCLVQNISYPLMPFFQPLVDKISDIIQGKCCHVWSRLAPFEGELVCRTCGLLGGTERKNE